MSQPFRYPDHPHHRRHGPRGYASLESFRPWVRDEFAFRCVYCLTREAWSRSSTTFNVDHFRPVALHPEYALEYDNLLYACSTCNSYKRERSTPNPLAVLTSGAIVMDGTGVFEPKTAEAAAIIEILKLNDPPAIEFRRIWLEIIQLAKMARPDLYFTLLGFPQDLPRLTSLRPPDGNTRPEGVTHSYHEQRERGKLPETY